MIIAAITFGIIFWLFYYLFIKGNAWPIVLLIFGVWGGTKFFQENFESTKTIVITFHIPIYGLYDICWATFLAVLISILGIGVIMEKLSE